MVFVTRPFDLGAELGKGAGQGISSAISQFAKQKQADNEAERLRQTLSRLSPEDLNDPTKIYSALASNPEIAKNLLHSHSEIMKQRSEKEGLLNKEARDLIESRILAKQARGETLSPEEQSLLSPTSLRSIIGQSKPQFESESEKLEAKKTFDLASEIENDFDAYQTEKLRLDRQEALSEKTGNEKLAGAGFVKLLDTLGIPLSVLTNPETEEFEKIQQDYVRDINKVFRGQIRNFEIESYLKTVPNILNSPEGRKRIIQNRRILNEARKIKYDAYQEILKENQGKKPQNLNALVYEKVGPKLEVLGEKFKAGIEKEVEKNLPKYRMIDSNGTLYNIPANKLQDALENGFQFKGNE